jgi:hypothetical protein
MVVNGARKNRVDEDTVRVSLFSVSILFCFDFKHVSTLLF